MLGIEMVTMSSSQRLRRILLRHSGIVANDVSERHVVAEEDGHFLQCLASGLPTNITCQQNRPLW